jgi:hypothetical protein
VRQLSIDDPPFGVYCLCDLGDGLVTMLKDWGKTQGRTSFHPAKCSGHQSPGTPGIAPASALGRILSVTINPPSVARCP